jgi:tetratricopeptide (TPR) repeat protein
MLWIHVSGRKSRAWALLVFAFLAVSCSNQQQGRTAAREKLDEAQRLLADNHAAEALKAADAAVVYDPTWPEPHRFKADVYKRSSHFRQAYEELAAAYRLAPTDVQAALAVLEVPGYVPASELAPIARAAVAGAPDNPMAHYYLGLQLEASGSEHYPEAMECYRQSLKLAPDAILPLIASGRLSSIQGDQAGAVALLERAVALLNAGRGQEPPTQQRLEGWLELQTKAFFWLNQAYRRKGDQSRASKVARIAARLSETKATLRMLKDRTAARPDDQETRRRLQALIATGRLD